MNSSAVIHSIERSAVRILFILRYLNDDVNETIPMFGDHVSMIGSESKLQKVDFWIRNPDHLCFALLLGCEPPNGELVHHTDEIKDIVRQIFHDREPLLRCVPMRKYLRGAYEPLDEVMCFLTGRDLAYVRVLEKRHRKQFYLTPKGYDAIESIEHDCSEALWYKQRCQLIGSFLGELNGLEMRTLQYLETNYAMAAYGDLIAPIHSEVRRLFVDIYREAL